MGIAAYHNAPGQGEPPGQDLGRVPGPRLVKAPRLIFAELKADGKYLTQEQKLWKTAIEGCDRPEVYGPWRPGDWDEIAETLATEDGMTFRSIGDVAAPWSKTLLIDVGQDNMTAQSPPVQPAAPSVPLGWTKGWTGSYVPAARSASLAEKAVLMISLMFTVHRRGLWTLAPAGDWTRLLSATSQR